MANLPVGVYLYGWTSDDLGDFYTTYRGVAEGDITNSIYDIYGVEITLSKNYDNFELFYDDGVIIWQAANGSTVDSWSRDSSRDTTVQTTPTNTVTTLQISNLGTTNSYSLKDSRRATVTSTTNTFPVMYAGTGTNTNGTIVANTLQDLLNNKANSLGDLTTAARLGIDATITDHTYYGRIFQGTTKTTTTVDLSSYLPESTCAYDIGIRCSVPVSNANNGEERVVLIKDTDDNTLAVFDFSTANRVAYSSAVLPLKTGMRSIKITLSSDYAFGNTGNSAVSVYLSWIRRRGQYNV